MYFEVHIHRKLLRRSGAGDGEGGGREGQGVSVAKAQQHRRYGRGHQNKQKRKQNKTKQTKPGKLATNGKEEGAATRIVAARLARTGSSYECSLPRA